MEVTKMDATRTRILHQLVLLLASHGMKLRLAVITSLVASTNVIPMRYPTIDKIVKDKFPFCTTSIKEYNDETLVCINTLDKNFYYFSF